jgi:uncharacterized coiled-coil DUF342 family protein
MQPQGEFDLDALSQRIDSLASNRQNMINDYRRLDQRRRDIRKEIRSYTDKINEDRKALDDYYERLSAFKAKRRELLSQIRERKMQAAEVEKNLRLVEKNVPRGGDALQRKVEKLEWRLQTERLSRDEERELIGERKQLELKLKAWDKTRSKKKELTAVLDEIKDVKAKLDEMNAFKSATDPEAKARHERIASMLNARHELFEEIERINAQLMELDSNISKATQELDTLRGQRRSALEGRRSREHETNRARTRELVERAKDDARKKLEQGEKLSFDELKLVFGDGT